jgi:hypothetical protein
VKRLESLKASLNDLSCSMERRFKITMSNLLDLLKELEVPVKIKVFIESPKQTNYEYQLQMDLELDKDNE